MKKTNEFGDSVTIASRSLSFQGMMEKVNEQLSGKKEVRDLANSVVKVLVEILGGKNGVFYLFEKDHLVPAAGYGLDKGAKLGKFQIGEGLVGQSAKDRITRILNDSPGKYINENSTQGNTESPCVAIIPLTTGGQINGVIEIGSGKRISESHQNFLKEAAKKISIALAEAQSKAECQSPLRQDREKEVGKLNTMETSTMAMEINGEGTIISANQKFLEVMGYDLDEIVGKHHHIFVDEQCVEEGYQEFWNDLCNGKAQIGTYRRMGKGEKRIWLHESCHPIFNEKKELVKILKIATDITFQKEELHKQKQQLAILNNAALISETDVNGIITYANDKFCKISKYSREELLGQNHRILKSGKQSNGIFTGMWKAISQGKNWNGLICNKAKDGSFYWVDTTITPYMDINGEINKYVSVRFDFSDQIFQQEKLLLQTKELKQNKEELESRAEKLIAREEVLKAQQKELLTINRWLEVQGNQLLEKNKAVEFARDALAEKATELEAANKYKSEFLANMSHELRTPLNSILLLSKLLSENNKGNLNLEQTEFADVIYNSGKGLLQLINEVLDLSQVEAGKMDVFPFKFMIKGICTNLLGMFSPLAKEKNIKLSCSLAPGLPKTAFTDLRRLEQILKNFLSNAIKFTHSGEVKLRIYAPKKGRKYKLKNLAKVNVLAFEVSDTGIGVPKEKSELIFEAFHQVDGSIGRKYGGTGLGLSICRTISELLGGEIEMQSEPGKGSTFTLFIPAKWNDGTPSNNKIEERSILVPPKNNYKKVLIIEDNEVHNRAISNYLDDDNLKCLSAYNAKEGMEILKNEEIDSVILDMMLPDENGYQVLENIRKIKKFKELPVIVYTGSSFSPAQEQKIRKFTDRIVLKTVNSFKQLQSELNLILQLGQETKPVKIKEITKQEKEVEGELRGKKVLVVDDDRVNMVSLTKTLKGYGMNIIQAFNGLEALKMLGKHSDIEFVMMDIMMPEKDGYETMKEIRINEKWRNLPVIVITAKAIMGDREKCIEAGASDYISKPVDTDNLYSLLKIWNSEN